MEIKTGIEVTATLGMGMFEKGLVTSVDEKNKMVRFKPYDSYYRETNLEFNKIHGHTDCIF